MGDYFVPLCLPFAVYPPNCVGYWPFDNDTPTIAFDESGYNNHANIYGAIHVEGERGLALSFDGVDDYALVEDSPSLRITRELTITAWVKEFSRKVAAKIASRRGGNYFYFLGIDSGKPYGGIGDGLTFTVTSKTITMPLGEWHHLSFVYIDAEDKMYFYYDGVLKETVSVTQSLPATPGVKLSVGADFQGTSSYFNGLIDEVRIYNRALSQDEIKYIMGLRNPVEKNITVEGQVLDEIAYVIPSGAMNLVKFAIFYGIKQIYPEVEGEWIGVEVPYRSVKVSIPLPELKTNLTIKGFNDDDTYSHTIYIWLLTRAEEEAKPYQILNDFVGILKRVLKIR